MDRFGRWTVVSTMRMRVVWVALALAPGWVAGCTPATSPAPSAPTVPSAPTSGAAAVPAPAVTSRHFQAEPATHSEPLAVVAVDPSAPAPPPPSPAVLGTVTPPPSLSPALDPRPSRPRAIALLRTELRRLERLLATTPQSSPDRPAMLRRLAEDCVELRKAGVTGASSDAIASYTQLVNGYPHDAGIDEARYYLGLEALVTGNLTLARRAFYDLIRSSPSSGFIPYAYFAFGEIFFDGAKRDPARYDLAQQAYARVLSFPQSPVAPEAALQLVRVAKAKGDRALATHMRALLRSKYPSSPAAGRLYAVP